jgi:hypothetical protein
VCRREVLEHRLPDGDGHDTMMIATTRNRPNRMRAREPAPEAMPVKPRPPAMREITKQMRAHFNRVMRSTPARGIER